MAEYPYDSFCALSHEIGDYGARNLTATGDAQCAIVDRMGTYAQDNFKNQSDIAGRASAEFNVSQALQTKALTDQSSTDALNNAIGIKALTDQASATLAQMTSFERDTNNRIHENRWLTTKEIHDQADLVSSKAADSFIDIKNQLRGIELAQATQFGELKYEGLKGTTTILEKLGADKYDNMKDKIDALREECERGKWNLGLALQNAEISSMKNMINSVDQNQRFTSKTVQFGAGNVATPTQTANQA
jgi:hypothetical protein